MIKENTKRTLVWLFPADEAERWLSKTRISLVVPQLSPSGLRSLVYGLEKNQLILSRYESGQQVYGLTTIGKSLIETEIAGLKVSTLAVQNSSVLVFMQPPNSDRNFRYLRQFLIAHRWTAVTRGVFVFSGQPTESTLEIVQRLYAQAVLIFSVSDWLWGDLRLVIGHGSNISQAGDIYSGISRELDGLIGDVIGEKELDYPTKIKIVSIFDRLYSALKFDFNQVITPKQTSLTGIGLLGRLQLLG